MQLTSSLLLLLAVIAWHGSAFVSRTPSIARVASLQKSGTSLNGLMQPFLLADGVDGLDADTLQALGEVTELNDALDGALSAANPAVGLMTNLVASPYFIALPIGAGLLVSFVIGFFIFSYGSGKDD